MWSNAVNTIIVPLDGSELSERALGLGLAFAQAYDARLALVHVLEEPIALDLLPSLVIPDRNEAEAYLRRLANDLSTEIDITTHVLRGDPVDTLLDLTEDNPESILVMSTHGRSGLGRLMLGSVADKVVRGATVPVALVRGSGMSYRHGIQTLLVPLDMTSFSETALPLAVDLALRASASIGLVSVCEPYWVSPYAAAPREMASVNEARASDIERECLTSGRAYLDRVANDVRAEGVRAVWEVRFGKPADEILRAAETTEASLIVMATHDRSGLRRLALGSVTNEVLHRGTIPILTIPPRVIEQQQQQATELLSTI
jgi:nucleotide-binding universal stress UspA family protein